jgi:hypothetical protein
LVNTVQKPRSSSHDWSRHESKVFSQGKWQRKQPQRQAS